MNGSSLVGFVVAIIVLVGVTAIFFKVVDRVAKDALLATIAKIAVGCLVLVVFVLAIAGVLGFGGGGVSVSPMGVIIFAVGVLVLLLVLFIVDLFLTWLATQMSLGAGLVEAIRYVVTVLALIALLLVAGNALLSGSVDWGNALGFHRAHAALDTPEQDRDLGVAR